LEHVPTDVELIEYRVAALEQRMGDLELRLDQIHVRLEAVDGGVLRLRVDVARIRLASLMATTEARVQALKKLIKGEGGNRGRRSPGR
jgi:hypothetical protein